MKKIGTGDRVPVLSKMFANMSGAAACEKAALEEVAAETNAFEIIGTRDNLAPLIEEVNRSVRSRR